MNKTAEYFERLGRKFWFRGDYYKALEILRAGLGLYPKDGKLRLGIAMAQLRLGSYAVARELLAEILADSPENGDAQMAYCEAALHLGRRQDAVETAQRLSKQRRVSPSLLEHMGTLFLQHGVFEEAAQFLKKSLAADPKRPYALLGLGIAYKGLGREAEAVKVLQSAVRGNSRFYEALSYLGNIIFDRGRQKEAVRLFLKIPPAEQLDPVTLTRLIDFCRKDKKLARKVPAYESRLKEIATTYDIKNFIRMLEAKSAKPGAHIAAAPKVRYSCLKADASLYSSEQAERLTRLDALLKTLFGSKKYSGSHARLPQPSGWQAREAGMFFEELAAFLKTALPQAAQEPQRWLLKSGFVSLAPYAVALVRAGYGQQGPRQENFDSLMDSLVKLLRGTQPAARGARWFVELGGAIIGFWTGADMLERALLLSEILPQPARKNIAPMIGRGRAWRKWLGFKADRGWAHPSSKILPEKAASSDRTARCPRCGREIKDYGYISHADDEAPVLCGDCGPALSCPDCGGPLRQVSSGGEGGFSVYACMECHRRHQLPRRRR